MLKRVCCGAPASQSLEPSAMSPRHLGRPHHRAENRWLHLGPGLRHRAASHAQEDTGWQWEFRENVPQGGRRELADLSTPSCSSVLAPGHPLGANSFQKGRHTKDSGSLQSLLSSGLSPGQAPVLALWSGPQTFQLGAMIPHLCPPEPSAISSCFACVSSYSRMRPYETAVDLCPHPRSRYTM